MLLDIGVGILAALGLGNYLGIEHMPAFVWAGVVFALLPDVDALISLVQHRSTKMAYKHRDLLHLPLFYIPFGTIVIWFFNPQLAYLFALCSFLHFMHDSIGLGWGVQWLWPLNTDHYSFLYLYRPAGKPPLERKIFYKFSHARIDALDIAHGDPDWIHNIYVRFHPYAVVEAGVFFVALIVLFFALH